MGRPRLKTPTPKCKNGCRRVARIDGLCKVCHEAHLAGGGNGSPSKPENPEDSAVIQKTVEKMADAEAENWGRLFAEFTAYKNAAQVYAYQQQELRRNTDAQAEALERKRQTQLTLARESQQHYEQVTNEICAKYKMERKFVVIDVESRTIREERPEQA